MWCHYIKQSMLHRCQQSDLTNVFPNIRLLNIKNKFVCNSRSTAYSRLKKARTKTNQLLTNQTYLQGLRLFSQSRPSNKHCGLLHTMSHFPFMNTSQQLMGAVQLRQGLMPREQSFPSKSHAYV